jgi:putative endonuclease
MDTRPWYVYLIECKGGRIYTGATPNLEARFEKHSKGKGALFTKLNRPERIIASKLFSSKREALRIEKQVKNLPAQMKRILAENWSK